MAFECSAIKLREQFGLQILLVNAAILLHSHCSFGEIVKTEWLGFIAHFSERQNLSSEEIAELKKLIRGLDDGR